VGFPMLGVRSMARGVRISFTIRLLTMYPKILSTPLVRAAVLVMVSVSIASTASAMSLRELRGLAKLGKQGPNYVNYYLVGVMEGVIEAQAHAVRNGATATICLNGRRLEPSMAKSLYDSELKRNAGVYEADMPVQLVMFNALTTVYPC
jgi:hypothetical protein